MGWIKRNIVVIAFFAVISAIYIAGVTPDMTWMSLGGDSFDFVVSSDEMRSARPTGYPLYIMTGWVFEKILPFNLFWNLAFLSALSTLLSGLLIFLIVKHLVRDEGTSYTRPLAPFIATAAFVGTFLVWTQSVIPEVYTFTTFFMLLGTLLVFKKHYYWAAFVLGLGIGTHHLIVFAILVLGIYVWRLRSRGEIKINIPLILFIMALGGLAYLQCVFCVKEPVETSRGLSVIFTQTTGSTPMAFQLPLESTPERLWEFFLVIMVGIGVTLPTLFFLPRTREVIVLAAMALMITAYYLFSFPPQWVTFLVPAIAFTACLVGVGAARFPAEKALGIFFILPLALLLLNLAQYDIGNTVDPTPTTARQLYQQLDTVPDDSIVYTYMWGHGWMTTYYYCMENDWRVALVNQGGLLYYPHWYRDEVESRGVVLPEDYPGFEGSYYDNWVWEYPDFDREEFLIELQKTNPGKEIYVVVLKEADSEMVFGLEPITIDDCGNYIVPYSQGYDDRD